jgi:hypothetical protein
MARPVKILDIDLEIEFVEISDDDPSARPLGIGLLLKWAREAAQLGNDNPGPDRLLADNNDD